MLITINFSGAFDYIIWQDIIKNLFRFKIEREYIKATESILIDEKISVYNLDDRIHCSKSFPQGDCASTLL